MGTYVNSVPRNDLEFDFRDASMGQLTEPVTLDDVKAYLGIDHDDDDAVLTAVIRQARIQAEQYLNRDIIARARQLYYPFVTNDIKLLRSPVNRDVDIEITIGGEMTTAFEVLGLNNPVVRLEARTAREVEITYTTEGLSNSDVRNGVLALCGHLYPRSDIHLDWMAMLSPYKVLFI